MIVKSQRCHKRRRQRQKGAEALKLRQWFLVCGMSAFFDDFLTDLFLSGADPIIFLARDLLGGVKLAWLVTRISRSAKEFNRS